MAGASGEHRKSSRSASRTTRPGIATPPFAYSQLMLVSPWRSTPWPASSGTRAPPRSVPRAAVYSLDAFGCRRCDSSRRTWSTWRAGGRKDANPFRNRWPHRWPHREGRFISRCSAPGRIRGCEATLRAASSTRYADANSRPVLQRGAWRLRRTASLCDQRRLPTDEASAEHPGPPLR